MFNWVAKIASIPRPSFRNCSKGGGRSCLSDKSLSNLMKIAIESPDQLTDQDLEQVIDIWQRKNRKITV